ncbi:MAG: biosynthetic-type acetolactate synthase large subunit [Bacteroidaceae bacterium]|nr:biosynthetic-type acetolactate synthase large subunit [Bacteroidaceae bacterium]
MELRGSEILMESLKAQGVQTIFGYPGGSIMPVYDALYDYTRGEKKAFDHILVRHEQGAIHAAQGFARVSGAVGTVIVTSGPGVANTLTGVADAMIDSTPVVVIAGQVGVGVLGSDAFQELDLITVAQPICKWVYQIRRPEDIPWAVSKAYYLAKSGRPGPVVLDFPKNAQVSKCDYMPSTVNFVRSYIASPLPKDDAMREAAALLNSAQKPLALVGQGVELGGAQEELKTFLEKADIPAGRTMLGLSALPSNHPLNVGMLGMHGNLAPNLKQQEADVVIAIGMRFSDRVTGNLNTYLKQAKVIHLDIDNAEIDKNVKTDVAIVADCKEALPMLTALVHKADHKAWRDSFAPLNEREQSRVIEKAIHPQSGPLLMGEVVNAVAEATQGMGVTVTDVGQNQLFATRYSRYHTPRSIITSGGLGTMGYGLPAAIGATFAEKERPVCVFLGDGGLQMVIQELGTIMEYHCPVKIVLMNNNFLGNVRQWQNMFFQKRYAFTHMLNPDYAQICAGYGIAYERVTDRNDLPAAVERMLAAKGAYFLETVIMEEDDVMPMTPPGASVNDMMLEKEANNG